MTKMNHLIKIKLCSLFFIVLLGTLTNTNAFGQQKDYKEAESWITAQSGNLLLKDMGFRAFEPLEQPDENYPTIIVDKDKTFQEIEGFGGAFTDASAIVFSTMSEKSKQKFLTECFDPVNGNAYNLCRTTIHSCDFSDGMYTYDDTDGDKDLKNFTIEHDLKFRIPFIKLAQQTAKGNIRFFASPWSPPAWMKTNGEMKHGGKLKPEYRQTWADYFVKYIKAYQAQGIPMWGVTVQNEALAVQVWESCIYTAEEEKDFVRDYLGPTFYKNGLKDVKIMIWDHNRGIMYQRVEPAYEDPKASKYIWGTAYHWYVGDHHENARMVHDAFPDKKMLFTEGSTSGSWQSANKMARNIILDLNNWCNGWMFWNFALDTTRGPRHAGGLGGTNIVDYNAKTDEITFNPQHYVFGHFSRFIKKGAKRLPCTSSSDDLIATAFINPDGKIATVIYNLSATEKMYQLWIDKKALKGVIPPNGIITIVF
jgi:glucosylceramidase